MSTPEELALAAALMKEVKKLGKRIPKHKQADIVFDVWIKLTSKIGIYDMDSRLLRTCLLNRYIDTCRQKDDQARQLDLALFNPPATVDIDPVSERAYAQLKKVWRCLAKCMIAHDLCPPDLDLAEDIAYHFLAYAHGAGKSIRSIAVTFDLQPGQRKRLYKFLKSDQFTKKFLMPSKRVLEKYVAEVNGFG